MKLNEACVFILTFLFKAVEFSPANSLAFTSRISLNQPMLSALCRQGCRLADRSQSHLTRNIRQLSLDQYNTRMADPIEPIVGGTRYEFVPIPESMKSTTIYVGNICEFAHDDDLSALFQKVSKLHSVPACIARKVDTSSLQYGFVSFPSVEEKEVGRQRK
jgi:hypothetical protein